MAVVSAMAILVHATALASECVVRKHLVAFEHLEQLVDLLVAGSFVRQERPHLGERRMLSLVVGFVSVAVHFAITEYFGEVFECLPTRSSSM